MSYITLPFQKIFSDPIVISGIDSRYNDGMTELINYLMFGFFDSRKTELERYFALIFEDIKRVHVSSSSCACTFKDNYCQILEKKSSGIDIIK